MSLLEAERPASIEIRSDALESCAVLAFAPRRAACPHDIDLHTRDRILAADWRATAQAWGFGRVELCRGDQAAGIGDFLLIHENGRDLPSWGVGRENRMYCVWRNGYPGYLGRFETLREALDLVLVQPKRSSYRMLPVR